MPSSVLIANRGEIACRIIRTAHRLGLRTIAVYSDADVGAMHVDLAHTAYRIGPAPANESYLNVEAILKAAHEAGADAIHPGYGFLSENAAFAEAVADADIVFVGPPPAAIRAMGLKDEAKTLMGEAGVPVVPGYHGHLQEPGHLANEAARIGYPVLIKAVAGGGGKGMRRVDDPKDFAAALQSAQREAKAAFGDDRVLVEKYITAPRHIEIQVFADQHGNAVHLFERDCSLQRRHQKVVEEAPAPGMPDAVREAMGAAAVKAAQTIGYEGAGTVEFIADGSGGLKSDGFYFMEMNTRLQVEHPVTEMITGQDLVEWQLRVAAGEPLPLRQDELSISGHAFEVRLYAENPAKSFLPSTGTLQRLRLPDASTNIRVDTGVREGDAVSIHYDPMIAKLIVWDRTRTDALRRLAATLRNTQIAGLKSNVAFLAEVASHPAFAAADIDTSFIEKHAGDLIPSDDLPVEAKAFAALYLLSKRAQTATSRDPHSPWSATDGWRILSKARETLRFGGEHPFEVTVDHLGHGFDLTIADTALRATAELEPSGTLNVALNGQRLSAGVHDLKTALVILWNGHAFETSLINPLDAGDMGAGASGAVTAPMPGKIISVLTAQGAAVRRGDPLVILEAMKMEHTLTAGADGTVGTISVTEGDQVEEGALVVQIEAEA